MSSYCDACLFYACIVFRYLLVGKIVIMPNADYVVDLKPTLNKASYVLYHMRLLDIFCIFCNPVCVLGMFIHLE